MGWIKRNLFFVVGGILALALLGGAGMGDAVWVGSSDVVWETTAFAPPATRSVGARPLEGIRVVESASATTSATTISATVRSRPSIRSRKSRSIIERSRNATSRPSRLARI